MFNNCNPKTNGELFFYNKIQNNINTIFDVGCRIDSEFINFKGNVHYFDPVEKFINDIKPIPKLNNNSYYNSFGLGSTNEEKYYYPNYQSFYNRTVSCSTNDDKNKIKLQIKKGIDYMKNNDISRVDFLKIDTEGYEFEVIKGFEEYIENIHIIQFEYGGTFMDNNVKLNDVITYLKKYNFTNFCYLSQNKLIKIEDMVNFIIDTIKQAQKHGYPAKIKAIHNGIINDHYNYSNIVCINKNSDLQNLFNSL